MDNRFHAASSQLLAFTPISTIDASSELSSLLSTLTQHTRVRPRTRCWAVPLHLDEAATQSPTTKLSIFALKEGPVSPQVLILLMGTPATPCRASDDSLQNLNSLLAYVELRSKLLNISLTCGG
mmetsp:Transcript_8425/g.25310  ORF Transcript_8425/g.25310 Transcript_8425/m.25310 type:complete len:124 (+) Transcript_8425:1737-2108(+)